MNEIKNWNKNTGNKCIRRVIGAVQLDHENVHI